MDLYKLSSRHELGQEHRKLRKMPKNIQKSLQKYISKIKKQAPHLQISPSSLSSISSTTNKILSGCKHPKTLSNDFESKNRQQQSDEAATLEDIDRFLIENFKSLYGRDEAQNDDDYGLARHKKKEKEIKREKLARNESESSGVLYDSPRFFSPHPDLRASQRFFTSSTSSGSHLEDVKLSALGTSTSDEVGSLLSASLVNAMTNGHSQAKNDKSLIPEGVEDCITVLTVSPTPYEDFRRSMQGVLDARIQHSQKVDWDFMEELLFCYLRLNEKKQYRFILSAFVDLVVDLRQNSSNGTSGGSQSSDGDNEDVKGKKRRDY